MDLFSYLLGKNASGGGGGSDIDWSAIGYEGAPQSVIDGYNYAKTIYDNWDSSQTSLNIKFKDNHSLVFMPLVDTSNVTDMRNTFSGCRYLNTIPMLNTSNVTTFSGAFNTCTTLQTIPLIDTSKAESMSNMFTGSGIKNLPILNTSKVTNFTGMFANSSYLTDESLDNVLQMCINATSYTGTKTLLKLDLRNYPATRIQALPHYQDFLDAGWTIGY